MIIDKIADKILTKITQEIQENIVNNKLYENVDLIFNLRNVKITFSEYSDLSTNLPILLSKSIKKSINEIEQLIIDSAHKSEFVQSASILNGFLNINLKHQIFVNELELCLLNQPDYCYGKFVNKPNNNQKINIEYVSVNPTGRLHLGHARTAIFADAIANMMQKIGLNVTKEYYINDAGAQIIGLCKSVFERYKGLCDLPVDTSSLPYPDESLLEISKQLYNVYGQKLVNDSNYSLTIKDFCVNQVMEWIKDDLKKIGISHDVFFSESSLINSGEVDKVLKKMEESGFIVLDYLNEKMSDKGTASQEKLYLFRITKDNGETISRPVKKATGELTYFASDIAYHMNKISRGFDVMIDVWGADHDSHVKTIKAAVHALNPNINFEIMTVQMVNLLDEGVAIKMSKRLGTFVSVSEVVDKIGPNVLRFMMLVKKIDTHFDFDLKMALSASNDNPFFYVNYAYARANSVIRQYEATNSIEELFPKIINLFSNKNTSNGQNTESFDKNTLSEKKPDEEDKLNDIFEQNKYRFLPEEIRLIKMIRECPIIFVSSTEERAPHRIITFLIDFSKVFHILWSRGREGDFNKLIVKNDVFLTERRVILCKAVSNIIESCLLAIGVSPQKEMN